MTYNVIRFDVKEMKLEVSSVEEVAKKFDESVSLKDGKFWINEGGEGTILGFRQEGKKYVLEYITSTSEFSGNQQEQIEELFKEHNGRLLVERTWEDGDVDTLDIKPKQKEKMEEVQNLAEAEQWFLKNHDGGVLCRVYDSESICNSFEEAKRFFDEARDKEEGA